MSSLKLGGDGKPVSLVVYDEPVCLGDDAAAKSILENKVPFATASKVIIFFFMYII